MNNKKRRRSGGNGALFFGREKMIVHKFEFNTFAEAEAFKEGVEFVNDSDIEKIGLVAPAMPSTTPWIVNIYDLNSAPFYEDEDDVWELVSDFEH